MPATRTGLRNVYDQKTTQLKLECAAFMDMVSLIQTTYNTEGDGLPIALVYSWVEVFRQFGRNLSNEGSLPNVEAVLRSTTALVQGLVVKKTWPGHGLCMAKIIGISQAESTLYPGQARPTLRARPTL
eukprot:7046757-Prymnesium_polylepis.1